MHFRVNRCNKLEHFLRGALATYSNDALHLIKLVEEGRTKIRLQHQSVHCTIETTQVSSHILNMQEW